MIYEKAIINALQTVEPRLTYIFADRNGIEPKTPYCLVAQFPIQKVGRAIVDTTSVDGKQHIRQEVSVITRLTLHALATDPVQDIFERLQIGLCSASNFNYAFYQAGLSINNVSDLTYISTPVDTVNFKRAVIDITCSASRYEVFEADVIKVVNTNGFLEDELGNETEIAISVEKQ